MLLDSILHVCSSDHTAQLRETLIKNGLHKACLEVALDEDAYFASPGDLDRKVSTLGLTRQTPIITLYDQETLITAAYDILSRICNHLRWCIKEQPDNKRPRAIAESMVDGLVPLWDFLWDFRKEVYTDSGLGEILSRFFSSTRTLLEEVVALYVSLL